MPYDASARPPVPAFSRTFFGARETFTRIGTGELGGKANGLRFIRDVLASRLDATRFPAVRIDVPTLTVLATDVFDRFLQLNELEAVLGQGLADGRLALAFQRAQFPPELVGDLRALVDQVRSPLAIRSSSLLEDALYRPFAGVYATKMIPNNQPDADTRFRTLVEAVKFVYASTFFRGARHYRETTGADAEKMAVVIQEVVGRRHDRRFYPDVSGVARSWNFYPSGRARPADGVITLALGLGKTIVDGGIAWSYSPARPRALPPVASARDLVKNTQRDFWAVNMGPPPAYDPLVETEYLAKGDLADAEFDGVLASLASTYDAQSDRLTLGTGRPGPRALTFAPLLDAEILPLNPLLRELVQVSEAATGGAVEIEFALTIEGGPGSAARLGFLQVRPMAVPAEEVDVELDALDAPDVLVASDLTMGNGRNLTLRDIVYVRPEAFDVRVTREVARELGAVNRELVECGRHYVLIGFGRWGSSDPWLGIPIGWDDISGARALVEAQLESFRVEPSQGSHFFHNLMSFGVSYFAVPAGGRGRIDWPWLDGTEAVREGRYVRHVAVGAPLRIAVDGRTGRGVICRP